RWLELYWQNKFIALGRLPKGIRIIAKLTTRQRQ
ncbi:MAG: hypothetical protein ACJA0M_001764, partial [Chitinophagales bacterium]